MKFFIEGSGHISHLNYANNELLEWRVNTDCETVYITSSLFQTENNYNDRLTIDGLEYYGIKKINQIVPKDFIIHFSSDGVGTDDGFILSWICADFDLYWSDWKLFWSDGSCNEERRLIGNGLTDIKFGNKIQSIIGPTFQKKATNMSCGK